MGKIVSIRRENSQSRRSSVVDLECVYETNYLEDGTPCVVFKTYNPNSQSQSKSQTIHVTPEIARQMINILKTELGV